jgi:peptidoglycan/xylan/chitin deacetylase (PgdA/CDA1 family)
VKPYVLPKRYRGCVVTRRAARLPEKVIALTFDDGPNADLTPLVLKALAQYKAKATFFVMGQWAQEYPALIAQEAAAGHAIESHSYSHPTEDISMAHAARELERTQTIIEQTAGAKPRLFRPPYGNLNWSMAKVAAKEGYCVVKWTICGSDSPAETTAEIVEHVTKAPVSGDIVLLHDGRCHNSTAKALPEILRRLSAKGYRFVTIPQLLQMWDAAKSGPATTRKTKVSPTRPRLA